MGFSTENAHGQASEAQQVLRFDLSSEENREIEISQYQWINRVIIVFSDSPFNPSYIEQLQLLEEDQEELLERDVIILVDSDPLANSVIRQDYHPRGFAIVVVGKDGRIFLRKPNPWTVREISRAIDKLPMRQQEIKLNSS